MLCFHELKEAEWLKKQDEGYYFAGSKNHHDWLAKRREAGRKGGLKKSANKKVKSSNSELLRSSKRVAKDKQTEASNSFSNSDLNTKFNLENEVSANTQSSNSPALISAHPNCKQSGADILFLLYNQNRGELPEARALNKDRRKKGNCRWKENPDQVYWVKVFKTASESSFLTGQTDRGWKANFDWLIKNDTNHLKVYEGAYERGVKRFSTKNQGLIEHLQNRRNDGAEAVQNSSLLDCLS